MAAFPTPDKKKDHQDYIDATCTSDIEVKVTDSDSTMDLEDYADYRHPEKMVNWNRKQRRKQQKILKRLIKKVKKHERKS